MDIADQQDRPEPDHTEDPRGKEIGEGGYAEEQPGGTGPPARGKSGEGSDAGRDDDHEATDRAPSTSSPSEGEPGEASGSPDAAGGS